MSEIDGTAAVRFGILAGLGIGYAECARRIERLRRYLGAGGLRANQNAVWVFAGVLLLPAGLVVGLVVVLYVHSAVHGALDKTSVTHRMVFNAAAVVLASAAAAAVVGAGGHSPLSQQPTAVLATIGGLMVFTVVNLVVVAAGMVLATRPPTWRVALPTTDDWTTETATLVLGVITAELILNAPAFAPAVLILVVALRRSALVKPLEVTAARDSKTGVLTSGAWQDAADNGLARSRRSGDVAAVLLLDLDHFKAVNDTHGHVAGDVVLRAVADALADSVRSEDRVGRYGGEEFTVYLAGTTLQEAERFAIRLNRTIRDLRPAVVGVPGGLLVTASIGVAHASADGGTVDELVQAADAAMYAAKRAGRDRVRTTASLRAGPPTLACR